MKPLQAALIAWALTSPPDRIGICCGSGVKPVLRLIVRKLGSALASCAAAGAPAATATARVRQFVRRIQSSPEAGDGISKRDSAKSSHSVRDRRGGDPPRAQRDDQAGDGEQAAG